jgi:hypothetical protein
MRPFPTRYEGKENNARYTLEKASEDTRSKHVTYILSPMFNQWKVYTKTLAT